MTNVIVGQAGHLVTTGLTSGEFTVPMNSTIQINGGTPAWQWLTAVVNG